ncbi:hypothetical protein EJP69_14305 [Variovorax gossypii]|uniref:Leucine-rich repeat-containing N-terminal plant-type domain-containing protein n=1 Tax=Variovorax gossypii TaxID=1679495 RepID=A0A431TPZ4_9BURK|nr:hypothetical protein EJP69_14305 [Variovorax gossypii]
MSRRSLTQARIFSWRASSAICSWSGIYCSRAFAS